MDARAIIERSLAMAESVAMAYLSDLDDGELLQSPHSACNSINRQLGHLIASEHHHISQLATDAMPKLPENFVEIYGKQAAAVDASKLFRKSDLLGEYRRQRAATLELLGKQSESDLDLETGVPYAPTRGEIFALQGAHWLMHCGQWVVVRRALNKPVLI